VQYQYRFLPGLVSREIAALVIFKVQDQATKIAETDLYQKLAYTLDANQIKQQANPRPAWELLGRFKRESRTN
jgi:hypothetical protein